MSVFDQTGAPMPKALYSDRYQRFRGLLIERRREADLTQATVAERLSKPQSYVAKYEKGERRLDVVEFMEVAEAIGFDAVEFLRVLSRPGRSSSQ